ncbi:unnamed protein product, partial [Effrenium voratum]
MPWHICGLPAPAFGVRMPSVSKAAQRRSGVQKARRITGRITAARSPREVLQVVQSERRSPFLDVIALSAAWVKLAKLSRRKENRREDAKDALAPLAALTRRAVAALDNGEIHRQ